MNMLEGIIIFVLGYVCGMYNDKIKHFINIQIEKIFKKHESQEDSE